MARGPLLESRELRFESASTVLSGTLTIPDNAPRSPAVLLLSGSGPLDRHSNMRRQRIDVMRQVAEHLTPAGFATFSFDKRGVGQSAGRYLAAGFHDNVDDARAALSMLRSRPEVDTDQIFVTGHSEGALIATQLAGTGEPVAGIVLLAGPATRGEELLRWQARQLAAAMPAPVRFLLRTLRIDVERMQAKRLDQLRRSTADTVRMQLIATVNAKWFREFMAFDPLEPFARIHVPVLAITGAKDVQVDPGDIARLEAAARTEFTGHVLPDVTHLLRADDGPPSVRRYRSQVRRPVDRRVLELVTDWLRAHTLRGAAEP